MESVQLPEKVKIDPSTIVCRALLGEESKKSAEVQAKSWLGWEPLHTSSGVSEEELLILGEAKAIYSSQLGGHFGAFLPDGELVAVCIFTDIFDSGKNKTTKELFETSKSLQLMSRVSASMRAENPDVYKVTDHGQLLHLAVLATRPEYFGNGIQTRLVDFALKQPLPLSYPRCIIQATSSFTVKIGLRFGFKVVWTKQYEELDKLADQPILKPTLERLRLLGINHTEMTLLYFERK